MKLAYSCCPGEAENRKNNTVMQWEAVSWKVCHAALTVSGPASGQESIRKSRMLKNGNIDVRHEERNIDVRHVAHGRAGTAVTLMHIEVSDIPLMHIEVSDMPLLHIRDGQCRCCTSGRAVPLFNTNGVGHAAHD